MKNGSVSLPLPSGERIEVRGQKVIFEGWEFE